MFIVDSYALAVVFCFVTMLCWGSWGNTQKMAAKTWRYELFYWDYVIGMFLFALILSLTMGSFGSEGRPFLQDLGQASGANIASALLGGVIFNASNILLSASTALAGMAVAFPLGVGLALVLGVIINYAGAPKGDPVILFVGVALIVAAIVCNGIASGRMQKGAGGNSNSRKGIVLDEPEVLAAMEEPGEVGIRFLPVKVNKAGAITGEALVSAERLGKLARHTGRILREIGRELAAGNIAAAPFWRGPDHNACQWCEYAAACHFEEGRGGDRRRFLPAVRGEEFWQAVAKEQV